MKSHFTPRQKRKMRAAKSPVEKGPAKTTPPMVQAFGAEERRAKNAAKRLRKKRAQ